MVMPGREHPAGTVHARLRVLDCYRFHGRPGACVIEKFRIVNQYKFMKAIQIYRQILNDNTNLNTNFG